MPVVIKPKKIAIMLKYGLASPKDAIEPGASRRLTTRQFGHCLAGFFMLLTYFNRKESRSIISEMSVMTSITIS